MLTLENVLKLADLGFTKDEIMGMTAETPVDEAPAAPAPAAEPAPAAPAAPAPDPNAALIEAIADLKKTLQKSNLATTPQPVQPDLQEQADEQLLKLYNM